MNYRGIGKAVDNNLDETHCKGQVQWEEGVGACYTITLNYAASSLTQ